MINEELKNLTIDELSFKKSMYETNAKNAAAFLRLKLHALRSWTDSKDRNKQQHIDSLKKQIRDLSQARDFYKKEAKQMNEELKRRNEI